jgi:hypothetical protein
MKQQVEAFLKATGNYRNIDNKSILFEEIDKLIPFIQEELDELKESLNLRWVEGALDDTLDLKVYNIQLESLLTRLGCDVVGAGEAVAENNSLKYTTSKGLADKWLDDIKASSIKLGLPCPAYICITEVDGVDHYCLKNKITNKVVKYCGFNRVDLENYIPTEYGGNL